MPKIRGVKPELWTDENFVELSPYARLLWIGLWNHACDNGHLQDKSKQIKMRILPTDDVNCAELLREIEHQGMLERADGWITIPTLTHHQKPHKRWFVTCEKPGCVHPEGTSYGFSKPESTVDQPLNNSDQPLNNSGSTADVDGDVELMVTTSSTDVDAEFDGWWLAYPRKVGKGAARKAYHKARKTTDRTTLLTAIQQQRAHLMSKGAEFCPHAATWLSAERWADEPPQLVAVPEDDWMRRRRT